MASPLAICGSTGSTGRCQGQYNILAVEICHYLNLKHGLFPVIIFFYDSGLSFGNNAMKASSLKVFSFKAFSFKAFLFKV